MHRLLTALLSFCLICWTWSFSAMAAESAVSGRRLRPEEMAELIDHLSQFPPDTCRVYVLDEFTLQKDSEEALRKSVEGLYRTSDGLGPDVPVTDTFRKEVDAEVQRLLTEQESSRRVRAREQIENGDLSLYRYDYTIIPPGDELPVDAGFEDTIINRGRSGVESAATYRFNWKQKIAERFGPEAGHALHHRYWEVGSIGRAAVSLLRHYLEMDGKTRLKEPNAGRVQNLLEGIRTNDGLGVELSMRDFHHDEFGESRELTVSIEDIIVSQVVVPSKTFYPILEYRTYADNKLVLHSKAFGVLDGERTPEGYTIEKPFADIVSDRWHRITILEYAINTPLEDGVFDFAIPKGADWSVVDYVEREIKEADGRLRGFPDDVHKASLSNLAKRSAWPSRLVMVNILLIIIVVVIGFLRARRASTGNRRYK